MTRPLLVSEVFGPTWQGEGKHAGQLSAFVRLGGCNLHCWWCDTPYTWAFDTRHAEMHRSRVAYDPRLELKRLTPADVATQVREILPKGGVVVITGGEPLLQQEGIFLLLDELWVPGGAAYSPEIETAGTIQPFGEMEYEAIQWNVSPKLEHSRNEKELRYKPDVLRWFCESGDAIFKFVVQQESDLQEVERIAQECDLPDFRIWIMPEGVTADLVLLRMRTLSAAVLDRGWNLTSRLHTLIWDDARGR